ncbi:MAG: transcriptional regulator NrdR [Hornefia sp.]|nr:transcriptional regulator NrdR [Hornefia sp.]
MKCPFCDNADTKVIDSRPTEDGHAIRRRRGCERCGKRFTTYEKVEESIIMIIKRDGSRQAFDRNKIMNGIIRACEKRPVPIAEIERITNDIERGLNNLMEKEVKSEFIGELVMDELKKVDQVAYVRFASVYRQFTDVNTFIKEIEKLVKTKE